MLQTWRYFGGIHSFGSMHLGLLAAWLLLGTFLSIVASPPSAAAEPTFCDEMDGAHPVLQLIDTGNFRILDQYVDREQQLFASGGEVVRLKGPAGESAQLAFELPDAPVIDELQLTARIHCNCSGVQIAARVVMPRSRNSKTAAPHEILLRSGIISRGLPSEELVLTDLPTLLERQARVARLQTSDPIDVREAYVSKLVFLVPGGTGVTEFGVDSVELLGVIRDVHNDPELKQAGAESKAIFAGPDIPGVPDEKPLQSVQDHSQAKASPVHRIIQWHGEQFDFLAQLGFNAVWMSRVPSSEELNDAGKLGLSLVCPPPIEQELVREGISAKWDPVLAWDLGEFIAREDLTQVGRLKQLIQHHDPKEARGTIMTCEQISREASRATDAIVLGREILGSDLTLRDYVTWIGQRQRIARPGTPIWATIESELAPLRTQQVAALSGGSDDISLCASYDQLNSFAAAAMSVRCRDYVFTSNSSLATKNLATQQRARNLELANLRLRLLTPWLATGKITGIGRCSDPGLSAIVFQAERSHLLMPINWSRSFQSQQSLHVPGPVSFVIPGMAETSDVYLLTLCGTKRLRHERTTGGVRVSVDSLPPDGLIMLTSDAQAFSQVSQYLRQIAGRSVRLRRDCIEFRMKELEHSATIASKPTDKNGEVHPVLERAAQAISACDRDLNRGYLELAYQRADEVERLLSQVEYLLRNDSIVATSATTPLEFHVATLNDQRMLLDSLSNAAATTQQLVGGDFENLNDLLQKGWRHQQLSVPGIASAVRLSPASPNQGTYCLELEARVIDPASPNSVVPTAPVWISSPPINVVAGDVVEITGVARVPEDLIGSVDGLQIIDSLGGPGMATRILHTPSWKPFRILRGVSSDTQVVISLALSGLGRAQVDNLQVRTLNISKIANEPSAAVR